MNDEAVELDLRGLLCPLPVIRTGEFVDGLDAGRELVLRCTDPGVEQDLPIWCRMHGHGYLGTERRGEEIRVRIRIRPTDAP